MADRSLVTPSSALPTKLARPIPFTPKRPPSSTSDLPRATTLSVLNSMHKFKAPLSSEARLRFSSKAKSVLLGTPASPPKKTPVDGTRPRTPGTPKRTGAESPMFMTASEMDVSRVDPEEVVIDYQTIEPGDLSGEVDEALLQEYGKEDKVLVSVRWAGYCVFSDAL